VKSTALRRYTDLASAIRILQSSTVTLLDPTLWEDTNDSHYMELYKEGRGLQTLLALCFTKSNERFHYWRIFAPGPSGVCIEFDKQLLCDYAAGLNGVQMNTVTYLTLDQLTASPPLMAQLPFLKRYGFKSESEYRIIYTSKTKQREVLDIPISPSCIRKITFSPWMHPSVYDTVSAAFKSLPSCEAIKISRSTLIANEKWKQYGDRALSDLRAKSARRSAKKPGD
jgi:hypothetical protein